MQLALEPEHSEQLELQGVHVVLSKKKAEGQAKTQVLLALLKRY